VAQDTADAGDAVGHKTRGRKKMADSTRSALPAAEGKAVVKKKKKN
jgi:hypothetical protein